ncbi:hypothetical protein [Enterococcus sp. AZ103]|uniref:hypothetical protein n=1 Tax=Enterococcus sp. AZ103 TaxID=2774628 RepID=UPI003F21EB7C
MEKIKDLLNVYRDHFFVFVFILFLSGILSDAFKEVVNINYSLTTISGIIFILFDLIFLLLLLITGALFLNKNQKD